MRREKLDLFMFFRRWCPLGTPAAQTRVFPYLPPSLSCSASKVDKIMSDSAIINDCANHLQKIIIISENCPYRWQPSTHHWKKEERNTEADLWSSYRSKPGSLVESKQLSMGRRQKVEERTPDWEKMARSLDKTSHITGICENLVKNVIRETLEGYGLSLPFWIVEGR